MIKSTNITHTKHKPVSVIRTDDHPSNMKHMFEQMKTLFDGCDSTIDAMHISEALFKKYPDCYHMIISYRDSLSYLDNTDTTTKLISMESIDNADTKEDAISMRNNLILRSTDPIFAKALDRIVNRKRYKKTKYIRKYDGFQKEPIYIVKRCPHCGENMRMADNTTYVICGYPNSFRGYDWNGCCNDWCFSCEKMLCKNWEKDCLNIESNRYHDDECCKSHANKNGYIFPRDYCSCINNNHVFHKYIYI